MKKWTYFNICKNALYEIFPHEKKNKPLKLVALEGPQDYKQCRQEKIFTNKKYHKKVYVKFTADTKIWMVIGIRINNGSGSALNHAYPQTCSKLIFSFTFFSCEHHLALLYLDTNRSSLERGFRSEKVHKKNADNLDPEGQNLG